MDAISIIDRTREYFDGRIIEIVVWQVPKPIPGSTHRYKYRLFFGESGRRIIGFDNERGKGDHWHDGDVEHPYQFRDLPTLLTDFRRAVDEWRTRNGHADDRH